MYISGPSLRAAKLNPPFHIYTRSIPGSVDGFGFPHPSCLGAMDIATVRQHRQMLSETHQVMFSGGNAIGIQLGRHYWWMLVVSCPFSLLQTILSVVHQYSTYLLYHLYLTSLTLNHSAPTEGVVRGRWFLGQCRSMLLAAHNICWCFPPKVSTTTDADTYWW